MNKITAYVSFSIMVFGALYFFINDASLLKANDKVTSLNAHSNNVHGEVSPKDEVKYLGKVAVSYGLPTDVFKQNNSIGKIDISRLKFPIRNPDASQDAIITFNWRVLPHVFENKNLGYRLVSIYPNPLIFWVRESEIGIARIDSKTSLSFSDIADLVNSKKINYSIGNPLVSPSGLSYVENVSIASEKDASLLKRGLSSLYGHDQNLVQYLEVNKGVNSFFLDNETAKGLLKTGNFPTGYVPVRLDSEVFSPDIAYFSKSDLEIELSDKFIPIDDIYSFKNGKVSINKVRNMASDVIAEKSRLRKNYLIVNSDIDVDSIITKYGSELVDGLIPYSVFSSKHYEVIICEDDSLDCIKDAFVEDYSGQGGFQNFIYLGNKAEFKRGMADSLESIRYRVDKKNGISDSHIFSLIDPKIDAGVHHSMSGLTGGLVIKLERTLYEPQDADQFLTYINAYY